MGDLFMGIFIGVSSGALWDLLCGVGGHPKTKTAAKCAVTPPISKPWVCSKEALERAVERL